VSRLKAEGKMLAGGVPIDDRAFVFIIAKTEKGVLSR
jgi:hypothetical protein